VIEPVNFEGADLRPEDRVAIVGDECIFEWIEEGFSPREIGKMLGVSRSWLRNWLADDETRSARAREARRHSAHYWADKAERVLAEVGDNVPINRRRELSQLYRWRARVADPEFIETEKREHTHTIDGLTELVKYVQQAAAARIKPSHPGLIASSQPTQPSQDALVRLQGERLENPKRTD
jgi:transposase